MDCTCIPVETNAQEVIHLVLNSPHGQKIKETLFAYLSGFYRTGIESLHADVSSQPNSMIWHE